MNLKILAASFVVVFLAELGDKTQLTALAFSAQSRSQWSVFLGTSLALICTTALAVVFGGFLSRVLPPRLLHLFSGVMFVLIGLVLLVNLARKAPDEAIEQDEVAPAAESAAVQPAGPVGALVASQIVRFEEDLAAAAEEQLEQLADGRVREALQAVAAAHRGHIRVLRDMTTAEDRGERPRLDQNLEPARVGRLLELLGPEAEAAASDAVSRIIARQEAAAEFYVALARMIGFHDARDVLRRLATEEIHLAQELCALTQHGDDTSDPAVADRV